MAFWREWDASIGGRLRAFDDACTHRGCSLAEGSLAGPTVTCRCHKGRFDLRTGDTVEGPIRSPKDGERYFACHVCQTPLPDLKSVSYRLQIDNCFVFELWRQITQICMKRAVRTSNFFMTTVSNR